MSRGALSFALALTLGCAPIDVNTTVSVRPSPAPAQQFGSEQLASRDFVADYVQLGPRLLVSLREHQRCVSVRHVPVMRVEQIDRSSGNFVVWDFALGALTGGFAAMAFARPQLLSPRLVDDQGRVAHNVTNAYIVGGVFATISAALLTAGVVNALRSTNTTRYSEAFEVELGPERPCAEPNAEPNAENQEDVGTPASARSLRLIINEELEVEGHSDADGRARFELPAWDGPIPASGRVPAIIEVGRADGSDVEPRVLVLWLRVPFEGAEAHTGAADTRRVQAPVELAPIEGPPSAPPSAPKPAPKEAQP